MAEDFFMFNHESRDVNHKYFQFVDKRTEGRIPYATLILVEQYIRSKNQTVSQWKLDKSMSVVNWEKDDKKVVSEPINYSVILNIIKQYGWFNPAPLRLPAICEEFLDVTSSVGITTHDLVDDVTPQGHFSMWNTDSFLGENYPITPKLNREGIIISSFFDAFIVRITKHRINLVETSDRFFTFEWLFQLKDLINDAISSLEIVLHLIYNKAQFNPVNNWVFDKDKLGSKYGRRFKDKLKWVGQISGKSFNIEKQQKSLFWLQELRNHLNHFDPPSFCVSMEECADILNSILDIGMVHLTMRKTLGLGASINLINLVLQPLVVFKPEEKFTRRAPLDEKNEGYNTCRWPNPQA